MNKEEFFNEFKNNLKSALSELFEELNDLNPEWERCETEQELDTSKFTTNKSFNVKLSAVGNPKISKAQIDRENGFFYLDILVPGIKDGCINILQYEDLLKITLDEEYQTPYTNAFELDIKSDNLLFLEMNVEKKDGVLYITIPTTDNNKSE